MDTHPVTITIGVIGAFVLFALVGAGLGCTAYKTNPDIYKFFEPYYILAKEKKVC